MVMNTTQFDKGTGTSSKNIKFKATELFQAYKMQYKDFMRNEKADVKIVQNVGYEGPGIPGELSQSEDYKETSFIESYQWDSHFVRFGYVMRLSYEQNKFKGTHTGFQEQIAKYLTRGATQKYDRLGADVLNNAFTDTAAYRGGDGKPLYSASHPFKIGGTYSNLLPSAAFTKTVAKSTHVTVTQALIEQSIPAMLDINKIIHGTSLIFDIPELYNSVKDPDSANNRDNNLSNLNLTFKKNNFLSDQNAYHYMTQATELTMYEWEKPSIRTVPYEGNDDIGHKIAMAMNGDFDRAFGSYGSQGGS